MIVLVARYYVRAGQGDVVAAALGRAAELVRLHEPGCRMYQICRARENPDFFLLYEQYEDEAALAAHRETPHFREIVQGEVWPLLERREPELFTLVAG